MPIIMVGIIITRLPVMLNHSNGGWVIAEIIVVIKNQSPARVKTVPPTMGRFQEIIKIMSKINTGILCISMPPKISQMDLPGSIMSRENNDRNIKSKIDKILGVQIMNFSFLVINFI